MSTAPGNKQKTVRALKDSNEEIILEINMHSRNC